MQLRHIYKRYILQKKLGKIGQLCPQQGLKQSTPGYRGLPLPTRWSMQRSQYKGERSSCWVTNYQLTWGKSLKGYKLLIIFVVVDDVVRLPTGSRASKISFQFSSWTTKSSLRSCNKNSFYIEATSLHSWFTLKASSCWREQIWAQASLLSQDVGFGDSESSFAFNLILICHVK